MASDDTKQGGDFIRLYVIVMGVMALVLGFLLYRTHGEKQAFEKANALARAQFGAADAPAPDPKKTPTTITALAVGVSKYLATYRDAMVKTSDTGPSIPRTLIADRAAGVGLQTKQVGGEMSTKNNAKRYEETSVTVLFEPTDLDRLVKFMYNMESDPRIRILDVRWELRADKENPYEPGVPGKFGNAIMAPQVKIGFRRPLTGAARQ